MSPDVVRDILVKFLTSGKRFTTSDVVVEIANEEKISEKDATKYWDDIRYCVREMRDEFIEQSEFCDSMGMPHNIEKYIRTKVNDDNLCAEEINVYHPASIHAIGYKFPTFNTAPADISQEEAEEKMMKILKAVHKEPEKLCSIKPNDDGTLHLPQDIVIRISNLNVDEPIHQLTIIKGIFGVYDIYG